MGLFSRRRAAVAVIDPTWRPESQDIIAAPAYLMDDDGCAGDQAFGARFLLESAPSASLTVWAYPSVAGPGADDRYFVGYRIEYELTGADGVVAWSASLHDGDADHAELFDRPETATRAARQSAADLIGEWPRGCPLHVPEETVLQWFGWGGGPW